jgi:hypothetical protein
MVFGQHFGLPTRILDWTENPLVGLYFSVRDEAQAGEDGMLFAYRHGEREINIESSSDPFAITQIELMRPPHLDQRVIAQQSVFTAEPRRLSKGGRSGSDIKYWYVSGSHKPDIRNELAKLGITENTLFPGLVSLAAEIRNNAVQKMKHERGTKKPKVSKARSKEPTR